MRWGLAWSFEETKLLQFDYMKVYNNKVIIHFLNKSKVY